MAETNQLGGLFGRIALKKGLLREEDLCRALYLQDELRVFGVPKPLGEVLRDAGFLSKADVETVLNLQQLNQRRQVAKRFGRVVVHNGFADAEVVEGAREIARKERYRRPLAEILIEVGALSEKESRAIERALGTRARNGDDSAEAAPIEVVDLPAEEDEDPWEEDLVFAAVALRDGLVLVPELVAALREQRLRDEPHSLQAILTESGTLGRAHVEAVQRAIARSREERVEIPGCRIDGMLGHGATSVVFRGHQELLGRDVAVKVLREDLAAVPVEELLEEARATASVQHPHVVMLYDVGRVQRRVFYVMELVEGPSLMDRIRLGGALPEAEVLRIGRDVALALGAVEAAGLVHGDVKPHNVLMTANGVTKLGDLGLAREAGAEGEPGVIFGTPHTISPEAAENMPLDIRADLYGLGATLFYALTGGPPYDGTAPLSIVAAHLTEPVPDPRERREDLSAAAAELVMALLAKSPDDRPASPADVVARLEAQIEA
jgi:serine/threonine-protein kinase